MATIEIVSETLNHLRTAEWNPSAETPAHRAVGGLSDADVAMMYAWSLGVTETGAKPPADAAQQQNDEICPPEVYIG